MKTTKEIVEEAKTRGMCFTEPKGGLTTTDPTALSWLTKTLTQDRQDHYEAVRKVLGQWLLDEKIVYEEDHYFNGNGRNAGEIPCVDDFMTKLKAIYDNE